ncbi:hypothetical protein GO003_017900 [Methylicorpusculum oleiharenae]|uniref:hypothetical protein n=1 Tax=Methylicorpusculum oleiharenae TaxID=1338687 RepID=UPI001358099D|nr:hypothetical protein [Methylicorpusculum oleiharenae]MCD2452266.1 hypothetical protein [Methylicorpusculum oleiharenae]
MLQPHFTEEEIDQHYRRLRACGQRIPPMRKREQLGMFGNDDVLWCADRRHALAAVSKALGIRPEQYPATIFVATVEILLFYTFITRMPAFFVSGGTAYPSPPRELIGNRRTRVRLQRTPIGTDSWTIISRPMFEEEEKGQSPIVTTLEC